MTGVYKFLNNVQTHLIIFDDPFDCNGRDVIVCITGNPGLVDFYTEFAKEIHRETDLPVCVIGQAGHELVPDPQSNILKKNEDLFNLEGQVKHKLDLILNHIDKKSHLHLIGHSIGAWEIVELLGTNTKLMERVKSINLVFPTLQRMAESRNGKFMNNVTRRLHSLLIVLFNILYFIPLQFLKQIVCLFLKYFTSFPIYHADGVVKFMNPNVLEKVLFLAYNEMDTVTKLNSDAMNSIKHACNIIYSNRDNWAPIEYLEELNKFLPEIKIRVVDVEHAFVMKSSKQVAEMVCEFIKDKLDISQ